MVLTNKIGKTPTTLIDHTVPANILVRVYYYVGDRATPPDVYLTPGASLHTQLSFALYYKGTGEDTPTNSPPEPPCRKP